MGPADSPRISRVLGYSGVHWASVGFRVLGCHRLWLRFPSYSANLFLAVSWILLPHSCRNTSGLGCSAFARHYWRNHCYFLFLRVLRCFSSPRSPPGVLDVGIAPDGLPHSEIHGSGDICSSPWLFAAYHVLHRLSVPRHPPCALYSLTIHQYIALY